MNSETLFDRYRELQSYVGWCDDDALRIGAVAPLLDARLPDLIDDFYDEIERHPATRKVVTGGQAQILRLKGTLVQWIRELLSGRYDADYVMRRWRVGWRHVEIGLDQVYTNVALSRLRTSLNRILQSDWTGDAANLQETCRSLDKLLDLDLAIIEDAYQAEYMSRLQRSERMATLGQVAGGIAHELRNPLNVVKTSVYYLRNARQFTPEKQIEHLQRIERSVELADNAISALSSFAKMPIPNLQPIAVEALLRDAVEANPPGAGIQVSIDLLPGLPSVLGDGDQLRIVFGNLIRNAGVAMACQGQVTITGSEAEGMVLVAVSDMGCGIAREDLVRIMEPLYSTKARGLGLGLAIARSILEKNQGTLHVVSELGRGSTFTVRLTAAPPSGNGAAS